MRKSYLAALLVTSAMVLAAPAAHAFPTTTFDWSYTDGGTNVGGGTLTAVYDGIGDQYTVQSISGTANGNTITGLDGYDGPDQIVFSPSPPDVALDSLGIAFAAGAVGSYNIYEDDGLYTPGPPYGCGGVYCLLGPGTVGAGDTDVTVAFTLTPVSSVPEPITLSIFGAGLAGAAALRRRKKAKA